VLARQYAWDNRERYQGVWWVRGETRETLLDDLIALGSRFNAKIAEVPDRAAAAQIVLDHIGRERPGEKPWLLVYDNVESPEAIDGLTPRAGAHVLITTRWADWYGHAEEVPVDVFPPEVAVRLPARRHRPHRCASRGAAGGGAGPAAAGARPCGGLHAPHRHRLRRLCQAGGRAAAEGAEGRRLRHPGVRHLRPRHRQGR
jgi:hypothetical protein